MNRHILADLAWGAAALGAAALAGSVHEPRIQVLAEFDLSPVSSGKIAGLLVGMLVGLRTRSLLVWLIGPSLGFMIGALDLHALAWFPMIGWTHPSAAMFPVCGWIAGWALGLTRSSWRRARAILTILLVADFLGRCAGAAYLEHLDSARWWGAWSALRYGPCACAVLIATHAGSGRRIPDERSAASRLAWGAALPLVLAGAWTWAHHQAEWAELHLPNRLERALRQAGFEPTSHTCPPGRSFLDGAAGYDERGRVGYFITPEYGPILAKIQVGETRNRLGDRVPVQILAEPWAHHRAMVLFLQEEDQDCETSAVPWIHWQRRLHSDPFGVLEWNSGLLSRFRMIRAAESERVVAAFMAAIARREEGRRNVPRDAELPYEDLDTRYGPLESSFCQAIGEPKVDSRSTIGTTFRFEPADPPRVSVFLVFENHLDTSGHSVTMFGRFLEGPAQRFFVNRKGKIIGGWDERPPDGYLVAEWTGEVHSRWVQIAQDGSPIVAIDLGPEAEAILKRRESEKQRHGAEKR